MNFLKLLSGKATKGAVQTATQPAIAQSASASARVLGRDAPPAQVQPAPSPIQRLSSSLADGSNVVALSSGASAERRDRLDRHEQTAELATGTEGLATSSPWALPSPPASTASLARAAASSATSAGVGQHASAVDVRSDEGTNGVDGTPAAQGAVQSPSTNVLSVRFSGQPRQVGSKDDIEAALGRAWRGMLTGLVAPNAAEQFVPLDLTCARTALLVTAELLDSPHFKQVKNTIETTWLFAVTHVLVAPAAVVKEVYASCTHDIMHRRVPVVDEKGRYVQVYDDILHAATELQEHAAEAYLNRRRYRCRGCGEALWTLTRGQQSPKSLRDQVRDALVQIPSIGEVRANRLIQSFGEDMLAQMLGDNIHNFINLMDEEGELIFSDRQAKRMERFLGNTEVSFGQGGYQPTEFIKRQMPRRYFGCLLVDEGHEYKNEGSAQGQAMGVLASQVEKVILLTGTLMGGYADDLFHLLYRMDPASMIEDGFNFNARGSIGPAAEAFMRTHGVMIDTYKTTASDERRAHRTARGETMTRHSTKGPGFGPKGIMRYVVPITAFLKLKEISGNVLPEYREVFIDVPMDAAQAEIYRRLSAVLRDALKKALLGGDHSLLGVVLNVLLAWPDCAFRDELVYHPHKRTLLASAPALYQDHDLAPKEAAVIERCRLERTEGRRVLLYTTYTGTRDTTARLKRALDEAGFKTAVLRATVEADRREDWIADQVERGVDVVITNPELVKTGLDLLDFPTIGFLQTGYNVYTLQQAARRSWRIGQRHEVRVVFWGYQDTAQTECLKLMAKKIAVSQSTSGDMPESGLDVLNQDGDSIEVALARKLVG